MAAMTTQTLGRSSLAVSRLAYGCWRLAGTNDPKQVKPDAGRNVRDVIVAAVEAGYTLFDHADIYCRGMCEQLFGEVLAEVRGLREKMVIATKCGVRFAGDTGADAPHRYDLSAEHILRSAEGSLMRLRIERIDLYQLHRPDLLMDPAEVAEAFGKLRAQGKVREFGVSNFSPSFVAMLARDCPLPLVVNQVEVHLLNLSTLYDGTLDQCIAEGMTPLAWSPLARGVLGTGAETNADHPQRERVAALHRVMDEIATKHGVDRSAVALAWLLKHPAKIVPIVGSIQPQRVRSMAQAARVELTREEWYRLLLAARGEERLA